MAAFDAGKDRLGILPNTPRSQALKHTLTGLLSAKRLPSPLDTPTILPPVYLCYVRRVDRQNLWVWYRVSDDDSAVIFHALNDQPPVPPEPFDPNAYDAPM